MDDHPQTGPDGSSRPVDPPESLPADDADEPDAAGSADASAPAGGAPPRGPAGPDVREVTPVDLRDWVDFSMEAAQRVRVFATPTLAQDLWCVEPQQSTAVLRYDDADVAYTVVGGRCWFVTDQGEVGLDPLASVLVPAGVAHGLDNRGTDPLIVLAASGPPGAGSGPDRPLTRLAEAIRPADTTGGIGQRLREFLAGG